MSQKLNLSTKKGKKIKKLQHSLHTASTEDHENEWMVHLQGAGAASSVRQVLLGHLASPSY